MDLYELALEDGIGEEGEVSRALARVVLLVGDTRLRLRTLTRMEECMLMVSLVLSVSLARWRVLGRGGLRWWFAFAVGRTRSSRGTSMSEMKLEVTRVRLT